MVGGLGLVTRRSCLVLSDALATEVYGAELPNFGALGYFRRPGETGWWINQSIYERTDDAAGLRGRVTGARGAVTSIDFDDRKTYPVRITDARGNIIQAEHDYRVSRIRQLTDASGSVYRAAYDSLARPIAAIEPGDTTALPTTSYGYDSANLPIVARQHRRAVSGLAQTIDSREIFDGAGNLLERRLIDEIGEIINVSQLYSARGFVARTFLERRASSAAYVLPTDDLAHTTFTYDALGRPIRQQNPDGSTQLINYRPLLIEEFDEEDTRTGAAHAGTATRKTFDPTGRVRLVQQNLGGRVLTSSYRYDLKGNLLSHTDAMGNRVSIMYDFIGHSLRVDRPEQTTISVFDAAGNAVEARSTAGTLVLREFDENNRARAVRFNDAASAPVIRFTYHDNGFPAPPEASVNTLGRCVRVDDESGSTIFDYDERGRVSVKRQRPTGMDHSFELSAEYRADGQFASLTYPNGGAGRRRVTYEYDALGRVVRIPSVVTGIEYELDGKRRRVSYANGTDQTYLYDDTSRRLSGTGLTGPGGFSRQTQYTTDRVGNLLRIDSPDPALRATYTYDDLYQLSTAVFDTGETWNYSYDDCGNITHKSDIGDYRYGENGAPVTCLTSTGTQVYTYTALGEMENTPWGIQTFNQMGRLTRIERADGRGRLDFTYDYTGKRVAARSTGNITPAVNRLTPDPSFSIENGALVLNLFDGEGIIARQSEDGTTLFLHADHLGSLMVVTDASGQPVERFRYDPYGQILEHTGTDPQTPIAFIGGTQDLSTGLVYLNARYYNPQLGRFISPDSVVQNAFDPIAWSPYVYCRNNPTSFVDPSGHSFWGIFLAAIAIIALIVAVVVCTVLDVLSFGTLTPILVVVAGLVIGGIVGGLSAAAKGGDFEDILTGILVGAAVGGWGAFAGVAVAGAVAGGMGSGFVSAVVSGAVSGTINGAAIGFAAGYAGGKGSLEEIWTKVWQGALIGLVAGAIVGGASYLIKPPTTSLPDDLRGEVRDWGTSHVPSGGSGPAAGVPGGPPTLSAPTSIGNFGDAAASIAGKEAGRLAAIGFSHAAPALFSQVGGVILVDVAAGAWDLGYVPWILNKIGVQGFSRKF
jgi:RHS repeat-associated protein